MNRTADAGAAGSARNLVVTRHYPAPPAQVFAAWTDPARIGRWWGPRGFTTTTEHMDIRPGGAWRFTMHGPDGRDYPNLIRYIEVSEPHRLVYAHDGEEAGVEPVRFHVTVTFSEEAGGTRLTLDMEFPSPQELDRVERDYGAREGGRQTLERLGEFLPEIAAGADFVISRRYDAPRGRVWRAWTERDQLMQWWGPKGFRMLTATVDLRPGGMFHYGMQVPDGSEMWGRFVYREIVAPELLVYVNAFSDAQGGLTRHPWSAGWPAEMMSRVEFAEDGGGTRVTIRWRPHEASEAEARVFLDGHGSMRRGWTGTLDQLEAHLAAG